MGCILGVDGGGTKTTVKITDLKGKELERTTSGPCNCKSIGVDKAIKNLNDVVFFIAVKDLIN